MFEAIIGDAAVELSRNEGDYLHNEEILDADILKVGKAAWSILYKGKSYNLWVHEVRADKSEVVLSINGKKTTVHIRSQIARLLKDLGLENALVNKLDSLNSPMPGLIRSIKVAEGDEVKQGDPLLILEAMKMENVIKSPGEGVVSKILVKESDSVEKNEPLIKFA